jgi:hypothetical protein
MKPIVKRALRAGVLTGTIPGRTHFEEEFGPSDLLTPDFDELGSGPRQAELSDDDDGSSRRGS